MLYGDNQEVTQKNYDWYYTEKYGYGVSDDANKVRLCERAVYIANRFENTSKVVDFGGGDSGLCDVLNQYQFYNVSNFGCGDTMPDNVDVIIAEHVLEHIYDMNDAMNKISNALKPEGTLIIDIPDAGMMALERPAEMPILDFTQVHINHFRMIDLLKLMKRWGFELKETSEYHERYGGCRTYVFVKGISIAKMSAEFTTKNMDEKELKLRSLIDQPVVVWGFGDICAHVLSRYWPNVQYFVCNDPAYVGETINGLPAYDKKQNDTFPVLVIAQSQKGKLIARIKSECDNEIIII
jgi:predicted SAM-dependent methyltransferase